MMSFEVLLWVYLLNATLLIVHEIDSAYWQEWKLFRLPGGAGGFVLLHLPLVALFLYGLLLVERRTVAGLVFSLVLSLAGIAALSIHTFFIYRGRDEFKTPVSLFVLAATLVVSLFQGCLTIVLLVG